MHVCLICIYQQICLNQLQLTVVVNKQFYMLHLPQTRRYSLCSYQTTGNPIILDTETYYCSLGRCVVKSRHFLQFSLAVVYV